MSGNVLRDRVARLGNEARSLAAIGAALRARLAGEPPAPEVAAVVDALGLADAVAAADPAALRPVLGIVTGELLLCARLASGDPAGWTGTDPLALRAAGDVSAGFPALLRRAVVPNLPGLLLDAPGAAFLDIGTGVGTLAIAMAREWPDLHITGLDPLAPALAIAREAIRDAGLADRIELREGRAEDLADEARFDLAWVPGAFIPAPALSAVLARAAAALKPGGWLLVAHADPGEDRLPAALARLRTAAWGGGEATAPEMHALLAASGLTAITAFPAPPDAVIAMAAGQRPFPPASDPRR